MSVDEKYLKQILHSKDNLQIQDPIKNILKTEHTQGEYESSFSIQNLNLQEKQQQNENLMSNLEKNDSFDLDCQQEKSVTNISHSNIRHLSNNKNINNESKNECASFKNFFSQTQFQGDKFLNSKNLDTNSNNKILNENLDINQDQIIKNDYKENQKKNENFQKQIQNQYSQKSIPTSKLQVSNNRNFTPIYRNRSQKSQQDRIKQSFLQQKIAIQLKQEQIQNSQLQLQQQLNNNFSISNKIQQNNDEILQSIQCNSGNDKDKHLNQKVQNQDLEYVLFKGLLQNQNTTKLQHRNLQHHQQKINKQSTKQRQSNKTPIKVNYNVKQQVKKFQNIQPLQQQIKNNQEEHFSGQNLKIQDFQILNVIGHGAYAQVRLAKSVINNQIYALKIYDKRMIKDDERIKNINKEIQILQMIKHPNIYDYYGKIENRDSINLIFEYMGEQDLQNYLESNTPTEFQVKRIFFQIAKGLEYLHRKNIVHRDIKLENIMVQSQNQEENQVQNLTQSQNNLQIKIIDFGFGTQIIANQSYQLRIWCGTPKYMAPELVNRQSYNGPPVDVWAYGVMLYKVLTGKFPFEGQTDKLLYSAISNNQPDYQNLINKEISNQAIDLIQQILNKHPNNRIKMNDILKHQWFSDV